MTIINSNNVKPALCKLSYTYGPNGQVKTLNMGEQSPDVFAETLDYSYTVRDWLDNINAPNDVINTLYTGSANFASKLYYDNPPSGVATPHYNGNISTADYFTNKPGNHTTTATGSKIHRYGFEYDNLNRLTDAQYYHAVGSGLSWGSG